MLVFTFASGSLSSLTGSFSGLIAGQGNAVAERFVVEQVAFTGTTGATVYVRNVGTIGSTLVSVFVADQSTGTLVSQFTISSALNSGAFASIPLTFTVAHGNTYSFTVTSQLGNSVIFVARAS